LLHQQQQPRKLGFGFVHVDQLRLGPAITGRGFWRWIRP
jgi:hypothetical protein